MSNRLDALLERMPRHFAREPDTNNYKLLKIIAQHSEDNRTLYDTVLKYWDVDQAEGVGLDRLGKDEGISRGGWDDDEYRKMIKIQCIVNLSEGDIPTMNLILDEYIGDNFVGFQDAYSSDFKYPAKLILWMKNSSKGYSAALLKRIKSAGVGIILATETNPSYIHLIDNTYHYPVIFPRTGEMVFEILDSVLAKLDITLQDSTYHYPVEFDVCELHGDLFKDTLNLTDETYNYPVVFPRTGEMEPIGADTTQITLNQSVEKEVYSYKVHYPITGEAVTGEEWFDQ